MMPPTTSSDLPLSINGQGKHLADRFAVLQLVFVALWFTIGVSFALQAAPHPASPRVPPIPEAQWSDEVRAVFTRVGHGGPAGNEFMTLARHPALLKAVMPLTAYVSRESTLPPRHRELLILRTAWLCRSEYLWAQHAAIAEQNGLGRDERRRAAEGPDASGWDPFEATLLRATDELYVNSFVTDETWNSLAGHYDRDHMLDALFTVAQHIILAGAMNSFGVQPDRGDTARLPTHVPYRLAVARLSEPQIRLRHPRIPPVDPSALAADVLAVLDPLHSGRLGGTAATYGYNLKLYQPRQILSDYLRFKSLLAASAPIAHEMLILRTALHNRSVIEWAAHQRFGRQKGMTDEQIRGITAGPEAPVWDRVEAALLRAADEMQRDVMIGAATWSTLSRRYDTQQLMDIAMTTAGYRFITMGQNALGLQAEQPPVIPPVWVELDARDVAIREGKKP